MRIHVSDPSLLDDLVVYLRAAECDVQEIGEGEIDVTIPRAPSTDQARRELELYVAAWRAMHQDAAVELRD